MSWVYLHRNAAGEVIYVGSTVDLRRRNRDHRRKSPWREEIASIEVDSSGGYNTCLSREAELIHQHEPRYNVRGNPAVLRVEAARRLAQRKAEWRAWLNEQRDSA